MLSGDYLALPEQIAAHARQAPDKRALVDGETSLSYSVLFALTSRIAAGLQRDGIEQRSPIAIVGATNVQSVAIFLGALQAGCAPTPMAATSTPEQLAGMITDSGAPILFVDAESAATLPPVGVSIVRFDELDLWCPPPGSCVSPVTIAPDDIFDIIYSSGTTGNPKGIVHTHGMRSTQVEAFDIVGFADAVTMVATPLYSNTTLTTLIPTLAYGGTAILLGKFDARRFLEVSEHERVTHAMLVPVQYQRIMAFADFDRFDLSSFRFKSCTSAPFAADLKADITRRWPGALLEIYGTTEGGGTCLLWADRHPNKLHSVGQPAPGNDIRLIDEEGKEVPAGSIGEVVGRSGFMMVGYHGQPAASEAACWIDAEGHRYIRHGDLGRFDEDGFLTLLGRSKDMIVSGGFNIYPVDIETVLLDHPAIADAAVIGVPSAAWGETPYAIYVTRQDRIDPAELVAWVNTRVGKTQRLSGAEQIDELPRSAIGKVLKRVLRDGFETASRNDGHAMEGC